MKIWAVRRYAYDVTVINHSERRGDAEETAAYYNKRSDSPGVTYKAEEATVMDSVPPYVRGRKHHWVGLGELCEPCPCPDSE